MKVLQVQLSLKDRPGLAHTALGCCTCSSLPNRCKSLPPQIPFLCASGEKAEN